MEEEAQKAGVASQSTVRLERWRKEAKREHGGHAHGEVLWRPRKGLKKDLSTLMRWGPPAEFKQKRT